MDHPEKIAVEFTPAQLTALTTALATYSLLLVLYQAVKDVELGPLEGLVQNLTEVAKSHGLCPKS